MNGKSTYCHPGCSPSRWHSTACHLETGCQRTGGRWDWHNLTRLSGWTAPPRLHPVHCEVPHNLMVLWPASLDVMNHESWSHWAGADQRRWCKSSHQRDWEKRNGQEIYNHACQSVSSYWNGFKNEVMKATIDAKINPTTASNGQNCQQIKYNTVAERRYSQAYINIK